MKLIIGLGNPGKQYEKTRHNVGFMCTALLREKLDFPEFKAEKRFAAIVSEGMHGSEKIVIAQPQTFMNNSGECVAKLFNFYHLDPNNLFLVYDDIDLPLGKIRMRGIGSAGTHNGMKSVIGALGFQNFPRLRIGIESRERPQDITDFVLHPFLQREMPLLKKALDCAVATIYDTL